MQEKKVGSLSDAVNMGHQLEELHRKAKEEEREIDLDDIAQLRVESDKLKMNGLKKVFERLIFSLKKDVYIF